MRSDFDNAATHYDNEFTFSEIGKAQRKKVYIYLETHLNNGSKDILEVNCGTGEDAHYLSAKGHNVIATDISEEMIKKALEKKYDSQARFMTLDINSISDDTFSEPFDLIFSNFGGLNCLSPKDLGSFLKLSEKNLKPNGKMSLVIMPKHCLWEKVYFFLKGNWKHINRRSSNQPIESHVSGTSVTTWYYNPKEIVNLTKQSFKVAALKPIGFSIPPSYMENFFSKRLRLLKWFTRLESWFSYKIWAKYADHYLIVLEKK